MNELVNKFKKITKQENIEEEDVIGIRLLNIKDEEVLYLKRFDSNTWIIDKDNREDKANKSKIPDIVKLELVSLD